MAIPDHVQVPSGTHTQRFLPASFTANSISVLNPNDGIAFVARDRDCLSQTIGAWDWKVPSQSYAFLPGPFRSVGILYLDRSGAALPGDISTYASEGKLEMPLFHAIGRAQTSSVTTLDIGQGTQPQPPAANNIRLWADAAGNLHFLTSANQDKVVIDSTNYATYVVLTVGDVVGPLNNTSIAVRAGHVISMSDAGGTMHTLVASTASTDLYNISQATFYIRRVADGAGLFAVDNAGNVQITGTAQIVGFLTTGAGASFNNNDVSLIRTVYGMNNTCYITNNGSVWTINGAISGNSTLTISGISFLAETHTSGALYVDNGHMYLSTAAAQIHISIWNTQQLRIYSSLMIDGATQPDIYLSRANAIVEWNTGYFLTATSNYLQTNGHFMCAGVYYFGSSAVSITWNGTYLNHSHSIQFNTTGNQIVWPNGSYISGTAGYAQGSNTALKQSLSMLPDDSLLGLVSDPRMPVSTYLWPDDPRRSVGFMADDIARVLPDLVLRNDNGEAAGYAPSELTAILWGAVRALAGRVNDLTAELNA